MSFYANYQPGRFPGTIKGNALNGLCEKTCIQVKKVFDACLKQEVNENAVHKITDTVPANPVLPLTFISAKNISAKGTIANLSVTRLEEKPKLARVQCNVSIPMEVIYVDSQGAEGKGKTTLTVSEDVILHIPEPSIIPFEIEASTGVICPDGKYTSGLEFSLTDCVTVVLKVIVEAELLIPSYGYCPIPFAQEFNQEICSTFFELPLFPGNE